MDTLIRIYKKLLAGTDTTFKRYLYNEIDWNNRIVGIKGARGVGKTTLMLQYIKEELDPNDALYVNADDIYFGEHRLIDLAEILVQRGIHYFFIDEIHKYKEWSKELKLIYDYYNELKVVFSGSSVLDLNKGSSDLSRRAVMYELHGLSFREYLYIFRKTDVPSFTLNEILAGMPEKISVKTPLLYFSEYLRCGYYPFSGDGSFNEKLRQIISLTLENDIPVFAGMSSSMGRKFKRLLSVIARSVPFKPNMSSLAQTTGAGRNHIADYLLYMEMAGMIAQLRDDTGGIRGIGKVEKIYLDNPNLCHALALENVNSGNMRETFFCNQMRVNHDLVSSSRADFRIGDLIFEIGGLKKGQSQIAGIPDSYIVKDNIESGHGNVIPLWAFGLNY